MSRIIDGITAQVSTPSNVATMLLSYTIPVGSVAIVQSYVVGVRTSDQAAYGGEKTATVAVSTIGSGSVQGSVATISAQLNSLLSLLGLGQPDHTITVSGQTVSIMVTGALNSPMTWMGFLRVQIFQADP